MVVIRDRHQKEVTQIEGTKLNDYRGDAQNDRGMEDDETQDGNATCQ